MSVNITTKFYTSMRFVMSRYEPHLLTVHILSTFVVLRKSIIITFPLTKQIQYKNL